MTSPYGADAAALAQLLRGLGADEDEIAESIRAGTAGPLALELVFRSAQPTTPGDAAAAAGMSVEDFAALWQALGFPPPAPDEAISAELAETAAFMAAATHDWLGEEVAIALARVVGSATARIAEAVVDAFRVQFEVPELTGGTPYSNVVRRYVEMTGEAMPALDAFVATVLRAHLVRVASGAWAPDDSNVTTRRDLFVGFVDLVGYTALSRAASPGELAAMLREFETTVTGTVGALGGRVVKLIGDGAMFVADDPEVGCRIAAELATSLARSTALPPGRVGADCGSVITIAGDYFGEVVNRAARLVALAAPSSVVVGSAVAERCGDRQQFEQLPAAALKGFGAPAVSYRLVPG
jgi:class 3 adenylate cyclase